MNIILFSEAEWNKPLPHSNYRAVHVREQLKLKPGDSLRVARLDGQRRGGRGIARLITNASDGEGLRLDFPSVLERQSFSYVHAVIGHPRPSVFGRLLSDLSSMGIARISFVRSELCEKSYLRASVWNAIDRYVWSGLEQGGHGQAPRVDKFYSLRACLNALEPSENARALYFHCGRGAEPSAQESFSSVASDSARCFAVGPDRGWTDAECGLLEEAGFTRAGLGSTILRTETASVVAAFWALNAGDR